MDLMSADKLIPLMIFVGIGAGAWVILTALADRRTRAEDRLEELGHPEGARRAAASGVLKKPDRFEKMLGKAPRALSKPLMPKTELEQSQLRIRLANAGWRSEGAVPIYLGCKLVGLVVGVLAGLSLTFKSHGFDQTTLIAVGLAGGFGFYLPDIALAFRRKRRQDAIFCGLPDALDLLVVCVESGLGLDAGMRKVCDEVRYTSPVLAQELSLANFQLQMGRPRREVLHDLGVRTGVDDLRSLAAILIQADRFGSSIAQALRVQSDSMRTRRRQLAEERAAKTAVKLIFPLVLFIFPGIFVVLVGPAGIQIAQNLDKMGGK